MSLESLVEWYYSLTSSSQDSLPHSSPSPSQPPFLHSWNPHCGISSVFFIRLLQQYKLLATSVAIMRTLERDGKSMNDGENTRWEQPCCASGECVCVFDKHTYLWAEWVCVISALECVCTGIHLGECICANMHLCVRCMWATRVCVCMCVQHTVEKNRIHQHVSAMGV